MTEQSILLLTRSAEFAKQIRSIGEELGYNIIAAKPGELEREGGRELRLPVIVDADGVSEPVELTRRLVGAGSRVLFAAGGGAEVELPTGSVRLAKPVTHEDLCRALVEVSGLLDPQAADQRPTLGLLRLDGTGRIASINPELAALLGYEKREELLGCSIEDRLTDTADWRKLLTRLQQDGRIIDYELEMITRWGGELTFSFSAIALEDDEGGLTGADCILKLGDGDLGRSMGELRRNLARVLRETARLAAVCTDEAELPGVLEACLPALPTGRLWLLEIDSENQHITACRTLVRRPIGDEFAAPPLDLVGMKRIVGNLERGKSQGGPLSELTRAFRRCLAERGAHSYALVPLFVAAPGELRHSARDDAPPERSWSHLLLWEGLEFVDDEAIEVLEVLGELLTGVLERLDERRLRQSALDEIHRIQENAPVAYQSLDDQGLILEVNDLWLEQLGYRREEVIGKAFNDFCAPRYKESQRANFAAFKERGHIQEAELELLRADGEVLPTLFNGRVERDESGGFVRTHCVFTDISAQKAYEGVVGDSEAQFRSLADNYRDGLVLYSRSSHKMIYINRSFEEIMGLERHKLAGMNLDGLLRGFVHPEDRPYVQERLLETLKLREEGYSATLDLEFRIQRPDGEVRWVRQRSFPRSDALGRITDQSYLGLSDITAAKRVERDLKMRDRILAAVSYVAELLLQPGEFAQDLEEVLENLGRAAGVSRVYLFENHQEKGELTASQRFEWTAPGVEPQIDNPELQRFSYHAAGFTSWVRGMEHGEAVVGRLEELDPSTREFLAAQDIRSIAVVPVYTGDEWWGFLGFDECEEDRRWSPAEVEALRSAAGIIGQAVKHQWFRDALERSERRYRRLFNSLSDAVFAFPVDEEGRPGSFISVNDVACERLGYTREEFLRLDLTDVDEPEYFEQAAERIQLIFEEGGAVFESVHRTKDGRRIPVEVNTHLVEADDFNGGGPRRIILSTARDISVRKAAEAALRESEVKYRNLVENANEGIVVAQGEHLVFVNPRMAEFMDLAIEEITRRPFLEFVHPEDRELIAERYARALADDKDIPYNYEFRVLDGAGRTRWMEIRAVLIQWNGAPAMLNFLTDITQRYEATAALKSSEREKLAILESMQELVAYYNEDLEIQWCNSASARSVGLTPDKLIGRHCYEIWHASDTPCKSCPVKEAFESGEPREAPMVTPDGRYWELHGYPVRDDEGRVIGAVEIGLDVTNEQKALQALSESEERHRRYINEAPEAVFIVGPDGRYAQVNRAACEITGYSEAELLELNIGDLLDIEDRESGLELFERVESEGRGKMELAARIKGGQRRFWSISSVRLSETRRMSFVLDITDRVLAERSLERRLRYEKALAAFSGTLLDESAGERIVEKALEPLLKASEADRVYIFENFVDAEAGLCMRQLHEACAAGVEPQTDNPELQRVPYDEGFGRWRELLSTGEVVRGPVADFPPSERAVLEPQSIDSLLVIPIEVNGAWEGFIGFDVCAPERGFEDGDVRLLRTATEMLGGFFGRLRVARALAESEEKFRTLSEQSLLGIAIAQGGEVTYANEALAEIYGLELDELIGHPAERYADYIHPEDRERMIEQLRRKQAGDRDVALHNTFRILRGGVELRWVDQYSRTIDYGGAPADFITLVDITERQLAEEALERHLRYEKALAACSRSLIEEAELEDALRGALTPLLEAAGACRVTIGENFADPEQGLCLRSFYEVEESGLGLPSGEEYFGCLPYAGPMRVIHDTLTAGGIYRGTVSGDDPGLEKLYRARGVMSQLALPISLGEKWWGVLTFEDCREEHDWADRDIGQLRVAASLLGSFFELRRANEALAESEEKFRTLSEQSLLGVAIVQDGVNVYVNEAFSLITGLRHAETGVTLESLVGLIHPEDRRWMEKQLRGVQARESDVDIHSTYRMIDAEGRLRWIDQYQKTINYLGAPAEFITLVDITERKRSQEIIRNIAEGVSGATGTEFFDSLVGYLAEALDMAYVFIGLLHDDDDENGGESIESISFCDHGEIAPNFTYKLEGTPCAHVIRDNTLCAYPKDVQRLFPEDEDLVRMGVESYIGAPLYDAEGRGLGIMTILDTSPIERPEFYASILRIFAMRVSTELERTQAELALAESEEKFRTLSEQSLLGVAIVQDMTNVYVNQALADVAARPLEELTGAPVEVLLNMVHPEDRRRVKEEITAGDPENNGGSSHGTYRIIDARGTERWIDQYVRRISFGGRPASFVNLVEITERQRAQQALRSNLEFMQTLLDTIPSPVFYKDTSGVYQGCNRSFAEDILGLPVEAIIGRTMLEFPERVPVELAELYHDKDLELVAQPGSQFYESRARTAQGELRTFYYSKATYKNSQGEVSGIVGVMTDIDELRRTEEALRDSERRLSTLMGNLPGMAYRCLNDENWTMLFVSEGALALTGYQPEALIDNKVAAYAELIHPDDRDEVRETVERALAEKGRYELTYRICTAEGAERWVWEQGRGVYDEDERPEALEGFITDITDRVRAEEKEREYTADLALLTETALDFVRLEAEADIWAYIARRLIEIVPGSAVFVAEYDPDSESLIMRDLAGEDPRLEPFFQRFSAVADGAALPLTDDERRWMLESKLMRFPFSAEALANWNVGEEQAREISETLGVYEIAAMGLVREGKLLGHVAIAPLDGAPLRKGEIVETFLNQASTTLQRQLSERALKVSQARYRFLFENSTALTIIVDLDGVILDTNQAMSEHTGYAKEEVIGRPVLDFVPSGHREDGAGLLQRTLNDTPTPETVLPIISADGEITQVLFSQDHATLEQDGKPYAVMITGVDVTERHRAQLALSRELEVNRALSELYPPLVAPDSSMAEITRAVLDKARELTASAHGYVSEVDPVDGVMLSHSLTEMMDDCAVEAAKRTIAFHPDEKGRYGGLWGHALNEGEPFYTNDPAGHPASAGGVPQGHIPLEAFLAYPVSVGGKLLGQIALANPENVYSERDLEVVGRLAEFYALALQRKRYEAALAESEQKLDKMVSTLSEGLVMVDNRGEFIYANPAAAEILEVEVEDFFTGRYDSRKWRQVDLWGEPYPQEELPLTVALRERRPVEHLEHGIVSQSGKLKWLSVSAAPLIDDDDRLYGAVASFHDISGRRRAEDAKEQYISELKLISETAARLNRARDVEEILDIVGERIHNLNTENYLLLTLRDPGEEGITIRRHYGFEGVQEKILSRFNEDPRRMSFRVEEMSEEEHRVYTSGRLEEVHGGLHTLGTGRLPKTITRAVEKLMGVKGVYTMGFSLGEEPFGGLILLRTSEGAPECRFALEAILKQASFLIRRRWAEEALAESEERFRRMADSIQDGLTIIEGDRTVYMNRRVGEIFGYSREEIARKGILEIAAPEERAKLEEAERRAKSSEDYPDVLEFWILTADGEHRCVQNRYSYPDDDPVKGRYIITTDVTAQRRTHEAIVQAKQEWVRTFDTVPDLVAILDDAFRINRVNRAMADKLGVAPHDLIGKLCYELFHGTGEPVSTCPHVQMLSDGREHIGEQKMLGGDYLVSVTPLVDEDGHMQGAVHVARDITESKKARRELFDSRESYRLLSAQFEGMLSAITDRVIFVDSQMQIVWANRAVEQYVGLPTEELRGRNAHAIWEDAGQCRNCVVKAAFNNGRREDCIRIENERRFEVTAFPVFDAKSIIGVIEVMRDVTEQHEAQEAVQRQAMVNQVEQIFSSIRHEIGNALNTLKTTITVLKGNIDTFPLEKRETYFQRILDTFKVAERLLRTLKEYQKFDELESELLFLDRFLREKGGLLVDNAFNNDVVLKLKLGCPHILVRVDRDALIRVLLNIVDNAISACRERPKPLIELASRCTDDWAVVTITDNGTGIAKKDLPNVFTPLYTTKTEGSGLGLAIVQKLVQQMGGLVRLDSYEDQGTRVTIRLPLVTDYSEDELPIK
jgi:PAS domain S-box-containing protein